METTIEKIRKKALKLAPDERASLAHELISSLDDAGSLKLNPDYEQEIQRRLKTVLAGHAASRPVKNVFADIEVNLA